MIKEGTKIVIETVIIEIEIALEVEKVITRRGTAIITAIYASLIRITEK